MALADFESRLTALGLECQVGRGPQHPTDPRPEAAGEVSALLRKYPALGRFTDYVQFLRRYLGAEIDSPHRASDRDFVGITIFGAGPWEFTEMCDSAMDGDYYVFSVIGSRRAGEAKDTVASFGFGVNGPPTTAVFVESHQEDQPPGPYIEYCSGFAEWLTLLIEHKGLLRVEK